MSIIAKQSLKTLKLATKIINAGGIVICPTDTVYGFLALANPPAGGKAAVEKIFKIKKRPKNKTLPIFVKDLTMAKELAEISLAQQRMLKSKWPGKFTFVLKARSSSLAGIPTAVGTTKQSRKLCNLVIAKNNTIALRVPKYKFLNDLLKAVRKPLAQTSVNVSSELPLSKTKDIIEVFGNDKRIDMIIDGGNLKKAKPSVIIDLVGDKISILRN